jgi:hypothetical protein
VVSFMGVLPTLSARDYAQATGRANVAETPAAAPTTAGAAQ